MSKNEEDHQSWAIMADLLSAAGVATSSDMSAAQLRNMLAERTAEFEKQHSSDEKVPQPSVDWQWKPPFVRSANYSEEAAAVTHAQLDRRNPGWRDKIKALDKHHPSDKAWLESKGHRDVKLPEDKVLKPPKEGKGKRKAEEASSDDEEDVDEKDE